MAALEELGTGLLHGNSIQSESVSTNLDHYIIESATENGKTVDFEDTMDNNGARVSRLIFNRQKQIVMNLIAKSAGPKTYATIIADFPEGDMCAVTTLTDYFVTSAKVSKTKGAWKIAVTLDKIFTNA